jgi:hypothetical protein
MDSTWPFFVILIGLLTGLGIMIANIDRANIINNWTERRCDIPVMFASFFSNPNRILEQIQDLQHLILSSV